MNAIRPSDPKVPALQQYYVYSADNNHVGPVSAELIARGVVAGKVPEDAFIAPTGSSNWTPISHIAEVFGAVSQAKKASTPPPPPPLPVRASQSSIPASLPSPPTPPPPPVNASVGTAPKALSVPPMPVDAFASPFALAPSVSLQSAPPLPPSASMQAAPPLPPSVSMQAAPPLVPAAEPPALAPVAPAAAPVAAAPEKKEEKKPVLDPRFKLLPLAIFAVFAFLGVVETAVVMILR